MTKNTQEHKSRLYCEKWKERIDTQELEEGRVELKYIPKKTHFNTFWHPFSLPVYCNSLHVVVMTTGQPCKLPPQTNPATNTETQLPEHSIAITGIYTMAHRATQYHRRAPHINQWSKKGADQSRPVYNPLIFFFFFPALSLTASQLLDNANRSQANGMERDNGAFIAAWLTWL